MSLQSTPASVAPVVTAAESLTKSSKFGDAIALLEKRQAELGNRITGEEKRALLVAIADAHFGWGQALDKANQQPEGIAHYTAAYQIDKVYRRKEAANDLHRLGNAHSDMGNKPKALDFYNQALVIRKQIGDIRGEGSSLNAIGLIYQFLGQLGRALDLYNQALPLRRQAGDKAGEAGTLGNLGNLNKSLGDVPRALEYFNRALGIQREVGDLWSEATTLHNLGALYADQGEKQRAIDLDNQALAIRRQVGDRRGEASTLQNLAGVYSDLGDSLRALDLYNQALIIHQAVGNKAGEAFTLQNLGAVASDMGDMPRSLDLGKRALAIQKQIGDKPGEANTLSDLGMTYISLGEMNKALEYFQQSLTLQREIGDKAEIASTLERIGLAYYFLGKVAQALRLFHQALHIYRDMGDKSGVASLLSDLGTVYLYLGEWARAADFYHQARAGFSQVSDMSGEANSLTNLGTVYAASGDRLRAKKFYLEALTIHKLVGNVSGEANTHCNLGNVHLDLKENTKAIECYQQALPLYQKLGDKIGLANTLSNQGNVYSALNEKARAIDYYQQALPLYRSAGHTRGEVRVLNNLAGEYAKQERLQVAAVLYKKSLTFLQTLRTETQNTDPQVQQTFVREVRDAYGQLIQVLVNQNRLPEAVQIYLILSLQNARQTGANMPVLKPDITPLEKALITQYDEYANSIAQRTRQLTSLQRLLQVTSEQKDERRIAEEQVSQAEQTLRDFFNTLPGRVEGEAPQKIDQPRLVSEFHQALQFFQNQTRQGVATVLTLVAERGILFLIVRDGKIEFRQKLVAHARLAELIESLRVSLISLDSNQLPRFDPRPSARKLHDLLLMPIAKDIAGCSQVFWALDGKLRYIPIATLHDGKKYLVQSPVRHTLFTAESVSMLAKKPSTIRKVLACSTSKKHVADGDVFEALVNVPDEIRAIRPTKSLADKRFTRGAFLAGLKEKPSIVHMATHFALKPGNLYNSFLLLGDGSPLRLSEVNDLPADLFTGVDLLALSACETGTGMTTTNGAELESFGYLAQRKGATTVLSSLWSVNDASTAALMKRFYANLGRVGPGGKAESLRQAQIALLTGKDRPVLHPGKSNPKERRPELGNATATVNAPLYKPGPKSPPCEHPYYWAPFTLLGDPR